MIDNRELEGGQDVVRLTTIALGTALAVWIAALRTRLQATREREAAALGLLDIVFERAPVGLALLDAGGRFLRVNERAAQLDRVPAEAHIGRTIAEALPELPAEVAADVERVATTGRPLGEVEVRPAANREWVVSYWPVRRAGEYTLIGVGMVLIDVTERRVAERALRDQTDRYETLLLALSEVGEGMVVLAPDGRCLYANAAFEQLSGYAFPELAAMESLMDLVVESEREEARRRAVLRAAGQVDPGYSLTMRRRDGALVDLEIAGVPLGDQLVVVGRDVTARRRAEADRERALARSALLAEASALFDQTLDEERTIASVARLCVRDLADTCTILLADSPGRIRRVATAGHEPATGPEPAMLEVMASGRAATDGRSVIVPLRARGRIHGVLAASFDAEPGPELLALLEDLGRRAALALDSARLYEERDHVARTLQRSLLPAELPEVPGIELAARYQAAGAGNEVGGDFYDCFPTGGEDWALVIGDVCGKGPEAATVTALARHTLRAAVLHTQRPRAVLGELNEALLRQALDFRFCTALYASLTLRDGAVWATIATGGHPLPLLLRADGRVEGVGRPGTLLGVLPAPEISEETVQLGAGDALVMFTDGVTEADRAAAPEPLGAFLAGCTGCAAAAIAEAIERHALEAHQGQLRDDVAVLVARHRP